MDNGVSSVDGVAAAKALGWRVVVTDHHLPVRVPRTPMRWSIPEPEDNLFPSKALAGVGVIFTCWSD